ncbi:MAG: phosphatase PAP2 family protein [Jatrophihabitans sp.]|uniref:phosphatase PAP2 family protein n=1 Tax=Jatrophihabitans sp. TaxID=1932789 RepID=UPI00391041C3
MPAPPLVAPSWRRACIGVIVAAIAVVAVVGAAVHGRQTPTGFDTWAARPLFNQISELTGARLLNLSSPALSVGGLAVVAALAALVRNWALVAVATVAPTVAIIVTEFVLKPIVHRSISDAATAYPSGHETGLVSLLVVLLLVLSRAPFSRAVTAIVVTLLGLWAAIGAIGLVRGHYHFPTDTIGGMGVAMACVLSVALVIDWISDRVSRPDRTEAAQLTRRS